MKLIPHIIIYIAVFLWSCQNNSRQATENNNSICEKDETFLIDSDTTPGLKNKIDTLELIYMQYACDCPQWVILQEHDKITKSYPYDQRELDKFSFYIEPATQSLELPEELYESGKIIKLIGKEYIGTGYPQNPKFMDPNPPKGRVFRYYSYESELNVK